MARLILNTGDSFPLAKASSTWEVFGTNGSETLTIATGTVAVLDASFNRGGDTVNLAGNAASYSARLSGSSLILTDASGGSITIPVGTVGVTLNFADAARTLVFNTTTSQVTVGSQSITATSAALTGGTQANGGTALTVGSATIGGADVMRLTGDQDTRIDFTNPANQIKGLDLNGNGVIANDGVENNITGKAANFEVVDAYARNPLNENDRTLNFLGDIQFDGTAFGGDGVSTDGNIVLGGLGVDTIFGGVGNDFLTGGGIAAGRGGFDTLSGGRNADFFFVELSALDAVDGNRVNIDGGVTADDNSAGTTQSAQDADWLLFEASDDDEPVTIRLRDDTAFESDEVLQDQTGSVVSRSGQSLGSLRDVENFDASGNLYGFLNGYNVEIGGRRTDSRDPAIGATNNGFGSSAQLIVSGSDVANIIIGGYDNDVITGNGGNDLLMGGNLNQLINPNLAAITNNGRDELIGGAGDDDIVFELDGGVIEGDSTQNVIGGGSDTLWVTDKAFGTKSASDVIDASKDARLALRLDLNAQNVTTSAGYGGADVGTKDAQPNDTQDQSHYKAGTLRTQVQDMENVITTGLGAVDYDTDGSNNGEVAHTSRMNFAGYNGNVDLRGTAGANILYANAGQDVLEGRQGDDLLSGGNGDDTFVFATNNGFNTVGDGYDIIHRQADANGDNIWDGYSDATRTGTFTADFGTQPTGTTTNSSLTLTLIDQVNPTALTNFPVNGVVFKLDNVQYTVSLTTGVQSTYSAFVNGLNTAIDTNPAIAHLNAVLNINNTITITDPTGKVFAPVGYTFVGGILPSSGDLIYSTVVGDPTTTQPLDRLIYRSYEDRADGELTNDDAAHGSSITLGEDAYGEDRVYDFDGTSTRIAEDQGYVIQIQNVTTQDRVSISINGVVYALTVGVDLDGNSIANEQIPNSQATIQTNFMNRYASFINSFMDDDTASGEISVSVAGAGPGITNISISQAVYHGEETVFMSAPIVDITGQGSGGEVWVVNFIDNNSDHEVELFQFNGGNNKINSETVVFDGATGINRAALATAKDAGGALNGTNALIVDGAVNTLAATINGTTTAVVDNQITSANLQGDFTVHGDDLLIGGKGVDTIMGLSGDDRVIGSLGTDVLDGGKSYYSVQVLGETTARVLYLNQYEASNPGTVAALTGLVISSINRIDDVEDGSGLGSNSGVAEVYDDTLQFEQADFTAGKTKFTITLDNYTVTSGVVNLVNGGAGTVGVDNDGNGTIDSTSTFTNFENVRTVSGTGAAVAGNGQGQDTLNLSKLSKDTGGIEYDMTDVYGQDGQVRYSTNANGQATLPQHVDYNDATSGLVMVVDGVENIIGGLGDDLLLIDEREAAKDNLFDGGDVIPGDSDDYIAYYNDFGTVTAEPVVTFKVNTSVTAADITDKVMMTGGRLGTVVATDTLIDVENYEFGANTVRGLQEADNLDLSAMAAGSILNYVDGSFANTDLRDNSTTIRDLSGGLQAVAFNGTQFEVATGGAGKDYVLVANTMLNDREDTANATATKDIAFASYLDYDLFTKDGAARIAFGSQTGADLQDTVNQNEYSYNLAGGEDTVDYSAEAGRIVSVVNFIAGKTDQYVVVDQGADATPTSNTGLTNTADRIDYLTGVERLVAGKGESIIDLTNLNQNSRLRYQKVSSGTLVNNTSIADKDTTATSIILQDGAGQNFKDANFTYVEYYDEDLATGVVDTDTGETALWNRVEGSDKNEYIELTSDQAPTTHTFNLRGGANEVNYNELQSTAIKFVVDTVTTTNTTTSQATTSGRALAKDNAGVVIGGAAVDNISSYNSLSKVPGTLRVEASQSANDDVDLSALTSNGFLVLGVQEGADVVIQADLGTGTKDLVLTGFEMLTDGLGDDVYDMKSLTALDLTTDLVDNGPDHDVIKVGNDAALLAYSGVAGNTTIDLNALNNSTLSSGGFDWDVLDITSVNLATVTTVLGNGDITDEVVLGAIGNIATATSFVSVVFTDATLAAGTTIVFDTIANKLTVGTKTITLDNNTFAISGSGTVMEGTLGAKLAAGATIGVTLSSNGTDNVSLYGTSGNDTITSAGGSDTIYGGLGADTLNGGKTAATGEVHTYTFTPGLLQDDDSAAIYNVVTGGVVSVTVTGSSLAGVGAPPVPNEVALATGTADEDQVGAAFASVSLATWEGQLGYAAGSLASVTYNGLTNELKLTFNAAAGNVQNTDYTGYVGNDGVLDATTTGFPAVITNAVAVIESNDTFRYTAAAESTAASMDTIVNFTINTGGFDDRFNLSKDVNNLSVNITAAGDFDFGRKTTAAADLNALLTDAGTQFAAGREIIVGATAAGDSYLIFDADNNGAYSATDMVVKMAGVNLAAVGNFDQNNVLQTFTSTTTFA